MKKALLSTFLLCFLAIGTAVAGNDDSVKVAGRVTVKPYGFVRNYFNYDSRKTVTVCGGEYLLVPYDEDWNITPEEETAIAGTLLPDGGLLRYDRNAVPQAHFQALSSRIGLALSGPALLGASTSGRLEGDFAGFGTSNTVLRLRLAYMRMDWHNDNNVHSLIVGQAWHPLSGDIMPEALGMAAGSPFRPHSRTPQLRYEWRRGGLVMTGTALFQYQFTSPGPNGENSFYANQSIVPEFFAGLGYRDEHLYTQLGIDYNRLTIREVMSIGGNPESPEYTATADILFKGQCHSFSPTFYLQYTAKRFSLKMRSTLAQNLGHLCMMSGYARVWKNDDPTQWFYKPMRASATYVDLAYGHTWRANLLLGYHKNFGVADGYSIAALYMKKGIDNINSIFRVAPSISYNTKAFNIGLEYEFTGVYYGSLLPDGTVARDDNMHLVANHRVCILAKYNF